MAGRSFRVVIVGGGAAGAFVATNLLRGGDRGLEVVVVEPRAELGLGVAYSTRDPWHRLNVPVGAMSAVHDDPDHFRRWTDLPTEAFARRVDYGRYVQEVLAGAIASSAASLRHVVAQVERLGPEPGGARVTLSNGETLPADVVVLATGVETPALPPYLAALVDDDRVVVDPWVPGALDGIVDGGTVAIIGTSLTAVDLAGSILNRHPRARVIAVSRNGHLPRPHEDPWRPRFPEPPFTVAEFLAFEDPFGEAAARLRASGADWPRAVDSLRPISQALWMAMGDDLRRTFLDDYRHDWEIHRHRMAAEIARDLDAWTTQGRFDVQAAAIEVVEPAGTRLRIRALAAGADKPASWEVDRIIVAIGPNMDPIANPLLGAAIADGILRPGPLGIGIDVDPATGLVIDANGDTPRPVFAMGALRKGVLWETLAVPEIRGQAHDVASRILGSTAG
ncbi:MAG TPA: FAD/NAD(P)-binding protein [Candidatus Limnocylindrales bacterium]